MTGAALSAVVLPSVLHHTPAIWVAIRPEVSDYVFIVYLSVMRRHPRRVSLQHQCIFGGVDVQHEGQASGVAFINIGLNVEEVLLCTFALLAGQSLTSDSIAAVL